MPQGSSAYVLEPSFCRSMTNRGQFADNPTMENLLLSLSGRSVIHAVSYGTEVELFAQAGISLCSKRSVDMPYFAFK